MSDGGGEEAPRSGLDSGASAFGARSAWLSLVGLRPRRARLRFAKQGEDNDGEEGVTSPGE